MRNGLFRPEKGRPLQHSLTWARAPTPLLASKSLRFLTFQHLVRGHRHHHWESGLAQHPCLTISGRIYRILRGGQITSLLEDERPLLVRRTCETRTISPLDGKDIEGHRSHIQTRPRVSSLRTNLIAHL
jgi:hypothetical protein